MKIYSPIILLMLFPQLGETQCSLTVNQTNPLCNGDCNGFVQLVPSGSLPFTYVWSTGDYTEILADLCAGTYFVTMTDGLGCIATETIEIIEPPVMEVTTYVASHSTTQISFCDGLMGWNVTNGTPDYMINWFHCGTTDPYSPMTYFCPGNYYCVVIDDVGCVDTSNCSEILYVAGMNDYSDSNPLITPNPFITQIQVTGIDQNAPYTLTNISGQIVRSGTIENQTIEDLEDLPKGSYLLTVTLESGVVTKTVIK